MAEPGFEARVHILGREGNGVKILKLEKRAHQRESPSHCIIDTLAVGFKGWRLPPGSSGDACVNTGAGAPQELG